MFPYIYKDTFLSINIDGKPRNIDNSHPSFDKIIEAVKADDEQTVRDLIDISTAINVFGDGKVHVKDGAVFYGDTHLDNSLTRRLLSMMSQGFNVDPLVKFLENLLQNPSHRAVYELYSFLEQNDLPITEDGHFLAYKKIRKDYTDIFTKSIDNSVGQIIEMQRFEVNDNKDQTCSNGLHFCSYEYLKHFGANSIDQSRVVILKINPSDVVSIPSDYNNAKGRCCKYEVVDEYDEWLEKEAFDSIVAPSSTPLKTRQASTIENQINDATYKALRDYTICEIEPEMEMDLDLDLYDDDILDIIDVVTEQFGFTDSCIVEELDTCFTVSDLVEYLKQAYKKCNQSSGVVLSKKLPARDPKTGRFVKRS